MSSWIVPIPLLTGVYAIALGSAKPADLVIGVLLAFGLVAATRGFRSGREDEAPSLLARIVAFPLWAVVVAREVVLGVWQMVRVSVPIGEDPPAGVIAIPIGERSRQGVAVTALTSTLSPGEVALEVDWEGGEIHLHVIDASDPDGVRSRHRLIYERYQRKVFP